MAENELHCLANGSARRGQYDHAGREWEQHTNAHRTASRGALCRGIAIVVVGMPSGSKLHAFASRTIAYIRVIASARL